MRSRRFDQLTWPEVADAVARGAGVVVPVGSTEQHGYHLPLATDCLLPSALGLAVADEHDLLVAPPLSYGYRSRPLSGGGESFPGTVSVRAETLIHLVDDVLAALIRHGFRRVVVLNWHMENANFVYEGAWLARERAGGTARILVCEAGFGSLSESTMALLFPDGFPGWDVEHASILETSLMLHLHPELVLMDRAVDDEAKRHPWYDVVPAPSEFVPTSGTLWKATQASNEKGRVAWAEIVSAFATAVATEFPD